ncbi:MAG: polysaccharide biosynthesis/export family protein [Candidatus Eisenbacteria bacterium]
MTRGIAAAARAALALALLLALFPGCGSRPGFEDDFTSLPEPEAPERRATDEEIEETMIEENAPIVPMITRIGDGGEGGEPGEGLGFDLRPEAGPFRLSPGDEFEIRFLSQPEMNLPQTVRPDGVVSFDLIGDLPVEGLTPEELARTLEEMYSVYLKNPSINILVRDFESRRFFVVGEVDKPGEYPLTTPTSLSQAVATAGSWTKEARCEDVMVIRMGEDGEPFAFKVNLKEILRGAVGSDPILAHMDIIYVPMGKIASARDFVDRFFGIILPPIDATWKLAVTTGYRR